MDKPIVGISGFSFTAQQMEQLHKTALDLGIVLREIPYKSQNASLYTDCDALAGDYDLQMIPAAERMKWFHSDWAGVETLVRLPVFQGGQAVLTNSAGAYGTMIAEYMIVATLMLLRHMPSYLDAQRKKEWSEPLLAECLWGKRVTVLGFGNNGKAFAQAAYALGAKVTGVDLMCKEKPTYLAALRGIDALDAVLAETEILAMCLPCTPETEGLIDGKRMALMPQGAIILNTGRGPTLDADALASALTKGHLGGAALDVFEEEPLSGDCPLWTVPNAIITPHISGYTADRMNTARVFDIFHENLIRWRHGETLKNMVDVRRGY